MSDFGNFLNGRTRVNPRPAVLRDASLRDAPQDEGGYWFSHSSATPLPRCRGAPSCPFLRLSIEERERSADQRILVTSTPGEACAPNDVGRTPTGAPPRCFASTGPFFRTGRVLSHPDPGEVLRSPFRPVRKAAPLGALAASLAGRRRTSRYASYSRGCEARAGWSPLPAPPHDTS